MTSVIQAQNLSVKRGKQTVLSGLSFDLHAQQVLALIGGNGAGKSTTLLALLGLLPLADGQISVLGHDITQDVAAVRQKTGYLPELAALYDHFTALENVRYFLSLAGVTASQSDITDVFKQVRLPQRAWTQPASTFSKGMRQKVALAICVLRQTQLILLDEPTSGLDPVAIEDFHRLIEDLRGAGKSILMVTHDLFGASETADRILLLQSGQLVGDFQRGDGGFDPAAIRTAFAKAA